MQQTEQNQMATVEQVVAALQRIKDKKAELAQEVKTLDDKIDTFHTWLLSRLTDNGLSSMAVVLEDGRKFSVQKRTTTNYSIADDDALKSFVVATGRIDVFQRRISAATVAEIAEQGKEVPGLNGFSEVKISVVKR